MMAKRTGLHVKSMSSPAGRYHVAYSLVASSICRGNHTRWIEAIVRFVAFGVMMA